MILKEHEMLLDIETTGLSKENDTIVSLGIMYNKNNTIEKKYFFADNIEEEKSTLICFLEFIDVFNTIYSYQGKRFEFSFIIARLEHLGIPPISFTKHTLVDLSTVVRFLGSKKENIEKALDYHRSSSVDGRQVITLYKTYIDCNQTIYKDLILKHQSDELDSLCYMKNVYQIVYNLKKHDLIKAANGSFNYRTLSYYPIDVILKVQDTICHVVSEPSNNASLESSNLANTFKCQVNIDVKVYDSKLRKYLPTKDYVYIVSEDKLLPKSLASFISKDKKSAVPKDKCYISINGKFIKVFTSFKVDTDIYYDKAKNKFILLDDYTREVFEAQFYHSLNK